MDKSHQKRKQREEEEVEERNKKQHSELDFSESNIAAESTKIEDFKS